MVNVIVYSLHLFNIIITLCQEDQGVTPMIISEFKKKIKKKKKGGQLNTDVSDVGRLEYVWLVPPILRKFEKPRLYLPAFYTGSTCVGYTCDTSSLGCRHHCQTGTQSHTEKEQGPYCRRLTLTLSLICVFNNCSCRSII